MLCLFWQAVRTATSANDADFIRTKNCQEGFTDDRIAMTPDMPLRASLPHAGHRSSLFPCPLPDLRAKEGLGKFVVDAFHKTLEKLCQLRPTWWTKWSENLLCFQTSISTRFGLVLQEACLISHSAPCPVWSIIVQLCFCGWAWQLPAAAQCGTDVEEWTIW